MALTPVKSTTQIQGTQQAKTPQQINPNYVDPKANEPVKTLHPTGTYSATAPETRSVLESQLGALNTAGYDTARNQVYTQQQRGIRDINQQLGYGQQDTNTLINQLSQKNAWTQEDAKEAIARLQRSTGWDQEATARAIEQLQKQTGWDAVDAAEAIGRLQRETGWEQEDIARQIGRWNEQAPQDLEDIRSQMAATGGADSGRTGILTGDYMRHLTEQIQDITRSGARSGLGRQEQVADLIKQTARNGELRQDKVQDLLTQLAQQGTLRQDEVEDISKQAYREGWGLQEERLSAEQKAARAAQQAQQQLSDLNVDAQASLEELNAKQKQAELEGQLKSLDGGEERTAATTWVRARYYELANSGMPLDQAKTTAILEAKQAYPDVPATYLNGAFAPETASTTKTPEQKIADWTTSTFGVPITAERAASLSPEKVESTKAGEAYQVWSNQMSNYMQAAGDRATAQGFLQYAVNAMLKKRPELTAQEARALIAKYPSTFSLLLAENELT